MALIAPTVETIGDEALTNSIIDGSVTELQDNMLTTLQTGAFFKRAALEKVVFGTVTAAKDYAFKRCGALRVADFYQSCKFYAGCFEGCSALEALILRGNSLCTCGTTSTLAGSGIANGTGYIYVPSALVDSYKTATNWSTYANQIRAIEDYPEVCEPYSWAAVAAHIDAGDYASVYKIGDTIPMDLGDFGPVDMEIVAFNADNLADGSGKAAITWLSKQVVTDEMRMNPQLEGSSGAYTEGTGTIGGWDMCEMRTYLNNTIKPLIPENVASLIRAVSKTQAAYNVAGSKFTQTTIDEVWIPTPEEVRSYSSVYDNRKKYSKGGKARGWWNRDAISTSQAYYVSYTGYYAQYENVKSTNTAGGVLGFCTGKSK